MAYQRKDMLDEDKWNIHSSGYRQEKYGSGKGESSEKHKHEHYRAKKEKEDYSAADDYRKKEDEEKKEEEDKGPSIEDTVKEEHEVFKIAAKQVAQEFQKEGEKVKTKRKDNKSIEDAINKAVKEEKETIIVDQ